VREFVLDDKAALPAPLISPEQQKASRPARTESCQWDASTNQATD